MKTELLDAYLSGDLRGESAVFIETALKGDDALREAYFQQVRMDAALRMLLADDELADVTPDRFAAGIMARLASERPVASPADRHFAKSVLMEILDERGLRPRPRMGRWDWAKAGLVAAAAVVLTVFLLQSVQVEKPGSGDNAAATEYFVAQLTKASEGAEWSLTPAREDAEPRNVSERVVDGEDGWLKPGRLELSRGVVEVTFNSGARVVLEGPAVMQLERSKRAFLESGRLTAEVPKAATGFVINTPRLNVVDIGTRFGLSVEAGGDTEVHVMQGLVEVSRLTGNAMPLILAEGLAVRADERTRSELQAIEYAGDRFALTVANSPAMPGFVHYGFNESGGPELLDSGRGLEGGPFEGSLLADISAPPRPMRSVGRSGGGLVFAPGERFDSPPLGGFDDSGAVSLAFWLRLPPGSVEDGRGGGVAVRLLEIGNDDDVEKTLWEVAWNDDPMAGKTGALKVSGGDISVTGSTDLQDGRWHHVAFRFIGGDPEDASTHLHLFVDGQLEAISARRSGRAETGAVDRLRLGGGAFEGAMDEFFVYAAAVAPGMIQHLAEDSLGR
jgi:hypothetical protein